MAPRAYWKGHLRLSLVSFPVQLHSATGSGARIQFHQIHRPTGKRVRHQKVVPGVGPIETDEIVKGYAVEKDRYVTVEPEELETLRLESKHTIDLVQFVGASEIDPLYYEKPYFVVPDGAVAQDAYRVICGALRDTGRTGLGQIVLSGREQLVALQPCGKGLLLETLRAANEVKRGSPYLAEIEEGPVDEEQLAMARELIERKTAPFDPGRFVDRYEAALRELVEAKAARREVRAGRPTDPEGVVVDLMAALKRSLKEEKGRPAVRRKKGATKHTAEVRKLAPSRGGAKAKAASGKRASKSDGESQPSRRRKTG